MSHAIHLTVHIRAKNVPLIGQIDEARAAVKAGLARDPSFTIHRFRAGVTSNKPAYLAGRERMYDGMRKAGVPEAMSAICQLDSQQLKSNGR